jgi:hypothetical protein
LEPFICRNRKKLPKQTRRKPGGATFIVATRWMVLAGSGGADEQHDDGTHCVLSSPSYNFNVT